jgi:hypothetical protein
MAKSSTASRTTSSTNAAAGSGGTTNGRPPVHTIRYRNLRAAIWENDSQNGTFLSVTFSRSYRDKDEQWHDVASVNAGDLPMLAKLANDCHSWIEWRAKRGGETESSEQSQSDTHAERQARR